jgi:hypothetical protein
VVQIFVLTSVKYETVNADLFIPSDAHSLDQLLLIAYGGKRCHKPTIAVVSLSHIVRGRTSDIELGFVENILRHC